jgi:soluble lytic murein transglycosylase
MLFLRKTAFLLLAACCCMPRADSTESPATASSNLSPALSPALSPPVSAATPVEQEFIAAMRRVRLGIAEPPDSPSLRAFVIYDYLVAARLRRELGTSPGEPLDAAIDAFLEVHGNEPVTHALRHDWLASLAQRARWDWFLPRAHDQSDPQLICWRLAGELATGNTEGLAAAALARWSLPQQQPPACDEVFVWLRRENFLTPALAESRARAALAADNPHLARESAADLPPALAAPLLQWAQLLETPQLTLGALARSPAVTVDPDALAAGFTKLARASYADAEALLPALLARPQLAPALQMRLRRAAALGAAYDHDPAAVQAFALLDAAALDEPSYEWRVRAALWDGNFARALAWIEQMPPALAAQPRWRYWHARAVAATAGADAAAPAFTELAAIRDYYGYLAADRVHTPYALNAKPSPIDVAAETALRTEPGLVRAHALFSCELVDDANAEWNAVVAHADPALKVQAARVAADWGWYAQSIATLAQSGDFDDVRLRYPRPYAAVVAAASELTQVPADWILGVMRQESLFRVDAVSRANARGLMQMLPATAVSVAKRWHLPAPSADGLFDPLVAIPLGAARLRDLLDRYGGQLGLALAAYNAGAVPVARWLPGGSIDADVWVENIPFNETRGYVEHIVEHIVAFAWVRDAELPRVSALLPRVQPMTPPAAMVPAPH